MTTHELKTWPLYFPAVESGQKTFEIRENDRNFQVGDTVVLREYDHESGIYSGRTLTKTITYLTSFEQKFGWVVFAIK